MTVEFQTITYGYDARAINEEQAGFELVFGQHQDQIDVWRHRVFDTVASGFVTWLAREQPDTAGEFYPGPGTFGVNTSDFVITKQP